MVIIRLLFYDGLFLNIIFSYVENIYIDLILLMKMGGPFINFKTKRKCPRRHRLE